MNHIKRYNQRECERYRNHVYPYASVFHDVITQNFLFFSKTGEAREEQALLEDS